MFLAGDAFERRRRQRRDCPAPCFDVMASEHVFSDEHCVPWEFDGCRVAPPEQVLEACGQPVRDWHRAGGRERYRPHSVSHLEPGVADQEPPNCYRPPLAGPSGSLQLGRDKSPLGEPAEGTPRLVVIHPRDCGHRSHPPQSLGSPRECRQNAVLLAGQRRSVAAVGTVTMPRCLLQHDPQFYRRPRRRGRRTSARIGFADGASRRGESSGLTARNSGHTRVRSAVAARGP